MSHTTTVKSVAIRDVAALRSAVAELQAAGVDCTLEEGANIAPRMYSSGQANELKGKCPFVLRLPKAQFDVGFVVNDSEGETAYAPVTDFHAGSVRNQIGAKCGCPETQANQGEMGVGHLMHLYGKHAAINAAIASGYSVEDVAYDQATGECHITVDASNYGM